ncbi:MAG: BatD family protein, partial [Myxococcota bacterium]|nr:BatD family protein [Myxococcota bacterium]
MNVALLLLLALLPGALAARLELAMDTAELQPGQTVSLQVQLVDGQARGLPDLQLPPGLEARYTGQSSSTVVVNFDTTRIVRYSYAVTARQPGTYRVGPARMTVGGSPLESPSVEVTVTPRDAETPSAVGVSASLSSPTPYLGQVVLFGAEYRRTGQVLDARWTLPDFDGFIDEKTIEGTRREYSTTVDGAQLIVDE